MHFQFVHIFLLTYLVC